jgi:pantoate--beta-alanine ligase
MKPEVLRTVAALRERVSAWRGDGARVGMVPTMGALHEGHLALVRAAQRQCGRVIVTLFVNPAQFAPTEDLGAYPRTEADDRRKLAELDADLLFAPQAIEMYPEGFATSIRIGGPSLELETEFRPNFFSGVATIVTKLLLAGLPDRAFFGEKDYQQLLVVKKLVHDLNIPTEIVGCPTIREPDGLAMSSRNAYLSPGERQRAPELHATLREAALRLRHGGDADLLLDEGRRALATAGFAVDYLAFRNAETLARVRDWSREPIRILVAARLGKTRLIDNLPVD